jgi:hypothetical protein
MLALNAFRGHPCDGAECGLQTLADVCGVLDDVPLGLKEGTEELRKTKVVYSEEEQLQQLLSGQICMINFSGADLTLRLLLEFWSRLLNFVLVLKFVHFLLVCCSS